MEYPKKNTKENTKKNTKNTQKSNHKSNVLAKRKNPNIISIFFFQRKHINCGEKHKKPSVRCQNRGVGGHYVLPAMIAESNEKSSTGQQKGINH